MVRVPENLTGSIPEILAGFRKEDRNENAVVEEPDGCRWVAENAL